MIPSRIVLAALAVGGAGALCVVLVAHGRTIERNARDAAIIETLERTRDADLSKGDIDADRAVLSDFVRGSANR